MTWEISVKIWAEKKKKAKKQTYKKAKPKQEILKPLETNYALHNRVVNGSSRLIYSLKLQEVEVLVLEVLYTSSLILWGSTALPGWMPEGSARGRAAAGKHLRKAGPATGSVFTNDNSCEQHSHQCLGNSPHHQFDLLPRWNFYWFIYLIFFFWTEINQGPMLETGKLHKSQQWNKLGTMPNSDGLGGLLHSVHVKISSCKEFPAKHTGCFYYRVGGIWYSIPIGRGSQWTRHYSTATSLGGHCLQKHTSVISSTAQSHI